MSFVRRACTIASVVVMCIFSPNAGAAHEIGTTRVSIVIADDGSYTGEIVTDARALADKLQASSRSRNKAMPDERLEPLFTALDATFRGRVHLAFDGSEAAPQLTYRVTDPGQGVPGVEIRLAGRVPGGARQLTWSYGWTFASYALTVRHGADAATTQWLEGDQPSAGIPLAAPAPRPGRVQTAARYLRLGFTHIVPGGLDHVLFVLGIYLLSGRARAVLCQVSAFTIAHSITLGLSMYGLIALQPRVVEPLIALSIAYVAVENIVVSELKAWRVGLVFAFGLLHGMGFAGALREVGLPRWEFATALVSFNAGVEAGQLAIIAGAFVAVGWYGAGRAWYRTRVVVPASLLIACVAVFWTFQRLAVL